MKGVKIGTIEVDDFKKILWFRVFNSHLGKQGTIYFNIQQGDKMLSVTSFDEEDKVEKLVKRVNAVLTEYMFDEKDYEYPIHNLRMIAKGKQHSLTGYLEEDGEQDVHSLNSQVRWMASSKFFNITLTLEEAEAKCLAKML